MAFSDWTSYNNGFNGATIVDSLISYIIPAAGNKPLGVSGTVSDNGSYTSVMLADSSNILCLAHHDVSAGANATITFFPSALSFGWYAGTISTQFQVFTGTGISGPGHAGLLCMQDRVNMNEGLGGSAYAFECDTLLFQDRLRFVKLTNGVNQGIQLGETATSLFQVNVWNDITLSWLCDPTFLKGTWLIGTINGVKVFDLVHTGSDAIRTLSSQGESVYANASTNKIAFFFRNTVRTKTTLATVNAVSYPPS